MSSGINKGPGSENSTPPQTPQASPAQTHSTPAEEDKKTENIASEKFTPENVRATPINLRNAPGIIWQSLKNITESVSKVIRSVSSIFTSTTNQTRGEAQPAESTGSKFTFPYELKGFVLLDYKSDKTGKSDFDAVNSSFNRKLVVQSLEGLCSTLKALKQLPPVDVKQDRTSGSGGALRILAEHLSAFEKMRVYDTIKEEPLRRLTTQLNSILKEMETSPSSPNKYGSEIQKAFQNAIQTLSKEIRKPVEINLHVQRGVWVDKSVKASHTIENTIIGEDGEVIKESLKVEETQTVVNTKIGKNYLKQALGKDEDPAKYLPPPDIPNDALRVSASKKDENLQGILINLQIHTATHDGKTETILQSGAPATHGMKPSIESLEKEAQSNDPAISDSAKAKIKLRTQLATAQALPKVIEAVRQIIKDPQKLEIALETGSFLHVEQSLLSSRDKKERGLILEAQKAFANISKNLTVKFGGEESVTVNGDKITVTLPKPPGKNIPDSKEYGVTSVLFLQGVNEKQSLGNFSSGFRSDPLQDEINAKGLNDLAGYYQKVQRVDTQKIPSKMDDLRKHFSSETVRYTKDFKGLDLIQDLTISLGGISGFHCKSGKDRTGRVYAYELGRRLGKTEEERTKIANALGGKDSLAYYNTGVNTGKRRGYAFNRLQLLFIPARLRPSVSLCNTSAHS